jgi:molybdenum cofactor cytidylyltransferase
MDIVSTAACIGVKNGSVDLMPMPVAAIIIAAGSSSRLGQPKQLLVVDGEPMLQRAIRVSREAGASPVFVVLGAYQELIKEQIDFGSAIIVANDGWEEGMASSVRAGVKAVQTRAADADGVLLMICDQPRVTAEHLRLMIKTFQANAGAVVIASAYSDTRGTPVLFPKTAVPDLISPHGDRGARALLANPRWPVIEIALPGGEVDIDRPEDLANLK